MSFAMKKSRSARILRPEGFTLLELLVVIVIIGLLSGLVLPRYFDTVGKSKAKVAKAQLAALDRALEQYRLDVGSYPSVDQGLDALFTQPVNTPRWQGPYLKKPLPMDPWNHPYVYKLSSSRNELDIISYGADGQAGGDGEAKDIALSDKD
jgi:general secretion pathway protein G